jgi:leucyl-tRNA synthetase
MPKTASSASRNTKNNYKLGKSSAESILVSISVLAPHLGSELLECLFNKRLRDVTWPVYNPELAQKSEVTIAIQVNGKLRAQLTVPAGSNQETVEPLARELIAKWLENSTVRKTVFVSDRLISFVI